MFKLIYPRTWDPVRLHDWFNLAVLAVLNAENFFYLATGRGFGVFYTSAMVYFLLDTVFVGIFPQSVKSPVVILAHHLCTSLYMLIPYHYPRYHWCMAHCMLVEVNTWLLIARRTIGGRAVEAGFYASWVVLRNLYYPYLIWAFFNEWRRETALCGSPWNPILVTPLMQAFLTGLNYHWTMQLVSKLLWPRRAGGAGAGAAGAAAGAAASAAGPRHAAAVAAGGGPGAVAAGKKGKHADEHEDQDEDQDQDQDRDRRQQQRYHQRQQQQQQQQQHDEQQQQQPLLHQRRRRWQEASPPAEEGAKARVKAVAAPAFAGGKAQLMVGPEFSADGEYAGHL